MTIAADALLVAERTRERLTERDAQILDRVMIVDVPVADRLDVEVDQTVTRDLIEHVLQKGHAGLEGRPTLTVQVETDADLGFERVTFDLGATGLSGYSL